KAFEVRDPKADKVLSQTKNGTLVLKLPAPDAGENGPETGEPRAYATRFTATDRCDDLIVLLEFLRRSTIETVQKFATYSGKAKDKGSKKRGNDIMEKCSRDVETGRMIVPPKYAKQYAEEQKLQEECATTVKEATTLLKSLAQQLIARLQDPRLLGKPDLPK